MTLPEFQAIVDLAAAGTPQTVNVSAVRNAFAGTDLKGCYVEVDGDVVTIRNQEAHTAVLRERARDEALAIVEANLR